MIPKLNRKLNAAISFAHDKNGQVHSSKLFEGRDNDTFTFVCKSGHKFNKTYQKSVNEKQWCPYWPCQLSKPKYDDEIGFKIFNTRLNKLHSGKIECLNSLPDLPVILDFKCKICNYKFSKGKGEILFIKKDRKHPPGCKKCGGSQKISLKEVEKLTDKLNIILLSKSIKNAHEILLLKCKKGHEISSKTYNKLKEIEKDTTRKTPVCLNINCNTSYSKLTLEDVIKQSKNSGIKFMDNSYKTKDYKKHNWECIEKGHKFTSSFLSVISAITSCPVCYDDPLFNSIPKIQKWLYENEPEIEISKGEKFSGIDSNIKLYCTICEKTTHKSPNQIKKRSLCVYCKGNTSELIVFQYMEQLFGGEWKYNTKPFEWLKNHDGNKMELDGYCASLNLAFEHHGAQHYKITGNMTIDDKQLKESKERDKRKEKLCFENGIKLIVINQLNTVTKESCLKNEIQAQCAGIKTKLFGGFYEENCRKIYNLPNGFIKIIPMPKSIHTKHLKDQFVKVISVAEKLKFNVLSEPGAYLVRLECNICNKIITRTTRDLLDKQQDCNCYGNGIDLKNDKAMQKLYENISEKHKVNFIGSEKDRSDNNILIFECEICNKNDKLIQPIHSTFKIEERNFRSRFKKPIINMELLKGKTIHPNCGAFSFNQLKFENVTQFIKRFEPTAEILVSEQEFTNDYMRDYSFKCSNKNHENPIVWIKKLREISQMSKNNSFGCKSCGRYNSNRIN